MSVFTNPASRAPEQAGQYVDAVLGLLGDQDPLQVLGATPAQLKEAIAGLSDAKLHQPETDGKWSIAEVLQHLADSEMVWAYRLRMTLAQDRPSLAGYDQDAWASRFDYAGTDPDQALAVFGVVRRANLAVLAGIAPGDDEFDTRLARQAPGDAAAEKSIGAENQHPM